MKMQRMMMAVCALALVSLFTMANAPRAQAQRGERVYIGLSKNAVGPSQSRLIKKYACPTPFGVKKMMKVTSKILLEVTPHTPCDEYPRSGKIETTWLIYVRDDADVHFGTHEGRFKWTDTDGNVWIGVMHGTIGCGTHRAPFDDCEECHVPCHIEGGLHGVAVAGPLFAHYSGLGLPAPRIEATYAGRYDGTLPSMGGVKLAIDGVHILRCP